ncbi:branched-chain amino acid ABC transporter substrate-binding protein [Deinococcus yavapaiensis]|uniref:Amino acid/amide ABC transporter substrate-binding protein (HAAT family) n=1 Tax=Deinococcus yavapaiensis KR-236 TaxID=694435 RepID=A0A318SGA2_9DEIO|nr:branched-chain amino acid ABC transporter substrate-binding protein [Deinococcus yavapaiensis]PYE48695.1 amino acid/amide ABC transporter substrate-binding protein (HAAT family) [Deinococcus yavapaiensis KR-236]
MFHSRARVILGLSLLAALSSASAQRAVKVATISPLTGSLAALGQDIKQGAEVAFRMHSAALRAAGLNVTLQSFDDNGNATRGVNVAQQILSDSSFLGVVGPLNSGVSLRVSEVLSKGNIAVISPTSTSDTLTEQKWNNFFRVVAPDRAQADAASAYIADVLKPKSVFVVTDNTTYGNSLTQQLQGNLKDKNVRVVAYVGVSEDAGYKALVNRVKESGAELVFFGGTPDKGGPFLKLLRDGGVTTRFMGGDALDSEVLTRTAGAAARDTLFTTVFGPVSAFANRSTFVNAYEAAFKKAPSGIAAFSFDAMNVLLDSLERAAKNGAPTRESVLAAVRTTNFDASTALTGRIAFTKTGERSNSPLFLIRVSDTTLTSRVERVLRYTAR